MVYGLSSAFTLFFTVVVYGGCYFLATVGQNLLRVESQLRSVSPPMELRFFGLRLYVIVQKTIANLGAAAIIGGVGIAVFDLVDRTREFKYLWMLIPGTLLGILFHIVCGAVPDLLRVLMRIEAHVRRGGPLR